MKDSKAKRWLEEWKQELESRIAAANDLFADAAVKSELVKILAKFGIRPSRTTGKLRPKKQITPLTDVERRLLYVWLSVFRDEYDRERIESILHGGPGREKGTKNKHAKPLNPVIAGALSEWSKLASLNPNWSERKIARKLAFDLSPVKTVDAYSKLADLIRQERRSSQKARFRRLAEAMA